MTIDPLLAAALCGVVIGAFLAIFGGGGSVLAAPMLLAFADVDDPHTAIGTASAAVAATALFNLIGHWRGGQIKWPCAIVFSIAGILGAVGGAKIALRIDGQALLLAFALAMAAIAAAMFFKADHPGDDSVTLTPSRTLRLVPAGGGVGLAAGFFGIGGGFLIVPGLIAATGMTMANATASSLVSVMLFGSTAAVSYGMAGFVSTPLVLALLGGGAIGGIAGLRLARVMAHHAALARRLFAGLILAMAVYVAVVAVTT